MATRSLTTAVLAVAAVGAAHTALAERRGRLTHAFMSEGLRQRLALAEYVDTDDEAKREILIGNSWLASVSVRRRARLLSLDGLEDVARRWVIKRPGVWEQVREPRRGEERDLHDREFNTVFELAHRRQHPKKDPA
ncbi:hypothetical protein ACFTZI_32520 [Streptomyces decoyicus]|uniref:hypothetical protein n=1 Tax=Streptomyces decoyicus TaxID=249567 RepID=UPI00362DB59B